jgi:hypothetical protein
METNGQIHFLATSPPRKAFGTHSWTETVWVPAMDWTFCRTKNFLALANNQTPQDLNFYWQHFPLQYTAYSVWQAEGNSWSKKKVSLNLYFNISISGCSHNINRKVKASKASLLTTSPFVPLLQNGIVYNDNTLPYHASFNYCTQKC